MSATIPMIALVLSSSMKECSAFGNSPDDRVGTTPIPLVGAPKDVQCPTMDQLRGGTYLQTDPWSVMRTINIRSKAPLFSDEFGAPTASMSEMSEVSANPAAPQAGGVTTVAPNADNLLGKVTAAFFSWTTEYHLRDAASNLVSKIVNPGFYWDTSQEIRDCEGSKLGAIRYKYEFGKMFMNRYTTHEVLDAQGQHIADLAEAEEESNNALGTRQYFIYLKDRAGNAVASMRNPRGGWNLGPFFEAFEVDIDVLSENVVVPPPASRTDFIALVFANALAMDSRFGPYWSIILTCVVILLFVFLVCCVLCNSKSAKGQMEQYRMRVEEEKRTLLDAGSMKESMKEDKSFMNCCSRR